MTLPFLSAPQIVELSPKYLIGIRLPMNHLNNRTVELWRKFMPRRKEIENALSSDLIAMQVFPKNYSFSNFDPAASFEKWACKEVVSAVSIPLGMESFLLLGGTYAKFTFKGAASNGNQVFTFIFGEWLPNSTFQLDDRPHFEKLEENYNPLDPQAEEEIYIPIRNVQRAKEFAEFRLSKQG